MTDQDILRRAVHDQVLDSLIAPDLEQAPDVKLAALYDEVMAIPSEAQEKEASARAVAEDPAVKDAERLYEVELLGKVGAHAYAEAMAEMLPKLAQGIEGIKTKILGTTPEERMRREKSMREQALGIDRARREQELSLKPREVSLDLGTRGATGSLETEQALQDLGVRESTQRQELANQLRKLQLGDQFARREREEQLFNQLHGEKQMAGPLTHALAGGTVGAILGNAANASMGAGPMGRVMARLQGQAVPKALGGAGRVGAGLGLGVYLARKALTNPNPASRPVTRLERERMIPQSMTSDVRP